MSKIKGKKPTREERKILIAYDLDTYKWLVKKHTSTFIELVNTDTGEIKNITL